MTTPNDATLQFEHCGGPYDLTARHAETSWAEAPTTLAECAVITYSREQPHFCHAKSLLHVGIGNSSVYEAVGTRLASFTGVTINSPELTNFDKKFGHPPNVRTFLFNKYDPRFYDEIVGPFDIILDVNLKSFACCNQHFHDMMGFYVDRLNPRGVIVTAESGLNHGWPSKSPAVYTPGASRAESATAYRILGRRGMVQVARQYNLRFERHELRGIRHRQGQADTSGPPLEGDEALWILTGT